MAALDLAVGGGRTAISPEFLRLIGAGGMGAGAGAATMAGGLSGPLLIAYLASKVGAPTPTMSAEDGDAAFARNAASTGGTGLQNTPEEVQALTEAYYGRPERPAAVQAPVVQAAAPNPNAAQAADEYLMSLLAARGGRGGVDFRAADAAGEADRKDIDALIARITAGRAGLSKAIGTRKAPELFDAINADARMRAASPDVRPDNTAFWQGMALPSWDQKANGFTDNRQALIQAAQLMQGVDRQAGKEYEGRIGQKMKLGQGAVDDRNLLEAFKQKAVEGSLQEAMPGTLEVDLTKAKAKEGGALARAQISAAARANAKGAGDLTPMEKIQIGYKLVRRGEETKDATMVQEGRSFIKAGKGGDAPGMKMSELKDLNEVARGNPALMQVYKDFAEKRLSPEQFVKAVTTLNAKK